MGHGTADSTSQGESGVEGNTAELLLATSCTNDLLGDSIDLSLCLRCHCELCMWVRERRGVLGGWSGDGKMVGLRRRLEMGLKRLMLWGEALEDKKLFRVRCARDISGFGLATGRPLTDKRQNWRGAHPLDDARVGA